MFKITKIYPRDIIAIIVLILAFVLKFLGFNTSIDLIIAIIVAFYFSKRLYEEMHPNGDLNVKVEKLEEEIKKSK